MNALKLFIFAGEKSGDSHGAHVLQAVKRLTTPLNVFGVGGPALRAQGLNALLPMEEFEVMGFSDVLKALPRLVRHFFTVRNAILSANPQAVLLVDSPAFTLRLAKALRTKGYSGKIIQLICPSVWAWGKKRIDQMADTLDLLLTIYPFEPAYFTPTKLPVYYVGNPILDHYNGGTNTEAWHPPLPAMPRQAPLIALFPGSRRGEIERHLPIQLAAAHKLRSLVPDAYFGLSYAHEGVIPVLYNCLKNSPLRLNRDIALIPRAQAHYLMRHSRCALAKSGTIALELALHQCPTVVMYKLTWLNRFIARHLLHLDLPYYCIANILIEEAAFPERIEKGLDVHQLAADLAAFICDSPERSRCLTLCQKIKNALGEYPYDSAQRAAQLICETAFSKQ